MALNTDYLYLKGVQNFGDSHISERLEMSLVHFLNWAFLEIGAFFNVSIPTSGAFGGDFSKLRVVSDPSYTAYTVYETPRQDIIFESGIAYTGGTPISISGVYVNDVFYAPGHATYGHYIDYPKGRVVFNSALPSSATVKMNYSYRWVQVHLAQNSPWWKEVQYGSFRVDDTTFTQLENGNWSIGSEKRVQLPAVIVDSIPRRSHKPYELGNSALWIYQDVNFDILSETKMERDKLMDILSTQGDKTTIIFNPDEVSFPLDYRGEKVSNPVMYPDYVKERGSGGKRWQPVRWMNVQVIEIQAPHPNLYLARVKVNFEYPFGSV